MELDNDDDKQFILNGINHGFSLIDCDPSELQPAVVPNHNSATNPRSLSKVEHRIKAELEDGNYIISDTKPTMVSALAAIEKPDGDIRLIHDLSRPHGYSVNDFASKEECHYTSLDDALAFCKPGSWMCKIDLKWAYRSFAIPLSEHQITGLQWTFAGHSKNTYLLDGKLPFGARKSPAIYNRITQAIQRMMRRKGYNCCAYLDDFICVANDKASCHQAFNCLLTLLRRLGLRINWTKVVDPCQCISYLGIEIDSVKGTLRLDQTKAQSLHALLLDTMKKTRLTKRQLQSIAGKLNWACNVHPWGRPFMASFFQAIAMLSKPDHKFKISEVMRMDMHWWACCLANDIHVRHIWDQRPGVVITTDSCSVGAGGFCFNDGDFCYINWLLDKPWLSNAHINLKELATVMICLERWAAAHPGHHFYVYSDSFMTTCAINKHYSPNSLASKILRFIAQLVMKYNISISAFFIKGTSNDIADAISRLHSPGQALRLSSILRHTLSHGDYVYYLPYHMSNLAFNFLLPSLQKMWDHWTNWIMKSLD